MPPATTAEWRLIQVNMKKRIYGFGNDYKAVVEKFIRNDIFTITGGYNEEIISCFKQTGIDYTVCVGAFDAEKSDENAVNIFGEYLTNFDLVCPNNENARKRTLDRLNVIAKNSNIKGIIVDFCRFSSPANKGFLSGFLSCFCEVCINKMDNLGFNSKKILKAVKNMYNLFQEGIEFNIENEVSFIKDWFTFRRVCINEHFRKMKELLKEVNKNLLFGAYVFSPYIAGLVGQNYEDMSDVLDYVSPMVYRHFRYEHGIACLDHELRAVLSYYDYKTTGQDRAITEIFTECFGTDFRKYGSKQTMLDQGLMPEYIGEEIKKAKDMLKGKIKLYPIILLEDDFFEKTLTCAELAGADEIDLFHYIEPEFEKRFKQ